MCVGIPGKVILVEAQKAKIEQNGHFHWLDVSLIEEKVKIGDYLLAYQNTAINKISPDQAKEVFRIIGGVNDEH